MENSWAQMSDADRKEYHMWRNAGISKHFNFRAKKYLGNEYVVGNQLTRSTYDNSYWLRQVVRNGKSYHLKCIAEWWIDPRHVYFNTPNENGEYDMKVNMNW